MSLKTRYQPSWPLPKYIFVPGENPHPKKVGGHMEGQKDPVAPMIDVAHPEQNPFLRFSVDLFNHGYFWESHVYFEALWNAHGRKGSVADFLKAMIKLGAAGVKFSIGEKERALEHCERAKELFHEVMLDHGGNYLGFDLKRIMEEIDEVEREMKLFELKPKWK